MRLRKRIILELEAVLWEKETEVTPLGKVQRDNLRMAGELCNAKKC